MGVARHKERSPRALSKLEREVVILPANQASCQAIPVFRIVSRLSGLSITSSFAFLAASRHFSPDLFPLLSPIEWPPTNDADFLLQVGFLVWHDPSKWQPGINHHPAQFPPKPE